MDNGNGSERNIIREGAHGSKVKKINNKSAAITRESSHGFLQKNQKKTKSFGVRCCLMPGFLSP